jgi:hypothetical protein
MYASPCLEKHLDDVCVACIRRHHQRSFAFLVLGIDIVPPRQTMPHSSGVARECCDSQPLPTTAGLANWERAAKHDKQPKRECTAIQAGDIPPHPPDELLRLQPAQLPI